jgi:hypothetical protein
MNTNLMLAVLAMDAYSDQPQNLGTAVKLDVPLPVGSTNAGFLLLRTVTIAKR